MATLPNTIAKTIPACISLCLVLCLVFSSLSAYSFETLFNNTSVETTFTTTQLEQGFVHHTSISKNEFLAELIDTEEKDDDNIHKNNSKLTLKLLRTLWSYSSVEADNHTTVEFTEIPILKIAVPCYIEYCSLKIPSLV